jgi:hypothetical protein
MLEWHPDMSRFTVCVYRAAGYTVAGAPAEWDSDDRADFPQPLGGGFRKTSSDPSNKIRRKPR